MVITVFGQLQQGPTLIRGNDQPTARDTEVESGSRWSRVRARPAASHWPRQCRGRDLCRSSSSSTLTRRFSAGAEVERLTGLGEAARCQQPRPLLLNGSAAASG